VTWHHIKTRQFTVNASTEQARRWVRVAKHLKCRSVSAWLEELAEEQAKRVCDRLDAVTVDQAVAR
jgi:hypothetical protein